MTDIIKRFISEDVYFYSVLLVLIAVVSFGLGRASTVSSSSSKEPTIQVSEVVLTPTSSSAQETVGQLVGSRNGTKYHALWCPGAGQIKDENKVFFQSAAAARAQGYTPAANCEGL